MPSPQSLRRLANVTKKVHDDLRKGGMAMTFKYLFRSTAILARVTAILADYVATQAGAPGDRSWDTVRGAGLRVENDEAKDAEKPSDA
jgi:hypothetical protein